MKYFLPTSIALALLSGVAYAKPSAAEPSCMKSGKVLTSGVELTPEQQALAEDLRNQKRENREDRRPFRREMKNSKHQLFTGYVSGEMNRRDVERTLYSNHKNRQSMHKQGQGLFLELLSTYDKNQAEIVISNMDESRECRHEKQDRLSEQHEEKIQRQSEKIQQRLFGDLDLTSKQQRLLDGYMTSRKRSLSERKDRQKGEDIESLLSGEINEQELLEIQDEKAESHYEQVLEHMNLMMDFVDSLNEDQRDQLLTNIEEIESKKKERSNEQRPRR